MQTPSPPKNTTQNTLEKQQNVIEAEGNFKVVNKG